MTADDQPRQPRASLSLPIVSALLVMVGVGFAFALGFHVLRPANALLLLAALALVLFRLAEMLRMRANNMLTAALSGVSLMIAIVAAIVLIVWRLSPIFARPVNPIDAFLNAADTQSRLSTGTVLAFYGLVAFAGLVLAFSLWRIVRANAFGARRPSPARGEKMQ